MTGLTAHSASNADNPFPDTAALKEMAARFKPTLLDTSTLADGEQAALKKLIQAARIIDQVFLRQIWEGNESTYRDLSRDQRPLGAARLHFFWLNKGPWSDSDERKAFLPDVPRVKPEGANFYPPDLTREEFEHWLAGLTHKQADAARSFTTVIRRDDNSKALLIVPYHVEYHDLLVPAAALLREAAVLTKNETLRYFLETRAAAFLTDDYFESDVAWMDLDAPIDVTIGPYETYNDQLFGYKAGFEAYVSIRDDAETEKLKNFASHLQDVEDNLPIKPSYRNPKLGSITPIRIVNELLAAGDGNHGVQTAAYNLPNDERVIQQKGSKKVMLKNVQHAKFDSVLKPIAELVLQPEAQRDLSFEWFFTHILAHELSHGIGPQQISVDGRRSTVRLELKELYSSIEEAKADITGLFMLQYYFDHGILPGGAAVERQLYATYLASSFRTLRFGITEAHGRGMALQFNYLLDQGAFVEGNDGTFSINQSKMRSAVESLTCDLLTIEAEGNYASALKLLQQFAIVRPAVAKSLARLTHIPIDIEPVFTTANQLVPWSIHNALTEEHGHNMP